MSYPALLDSFGVTKLPAPPLCGLIEGSSVGSAVAIMIRPVGGLIWGLVIGASECVRITIDGSIVGSLNNTGTDTGADEGTVVVLTGGTGAVVREVEGCVDGDTGFVLERSGRTDGRLLTGLIDGIRDGYRVGDVGTFVDKAGLDESLRLLGLIDGIVEGLRFVGIVVGIKDDLVTGIADGIIEGVEEGTTEDTRAMGGKEGMILDLNEGCRVEAATGREDGTLLLEADTGDRVDPPVGTDTDAGNLGPTASGAELSIGRVRA